MTEDQKQLIVRVEPNMIRRLKVLSAHYDMSMAQFVRNTLEDEIDMQRRDEAADQALRAAGL